MIAVELGESEEAKKEEIANRAEELLEQYRFNGSTFQFEYDAVGNLTGGSCNGKAISIFGDYNYVDPVSPACCQIITGMFKHYGYTIDKNIARCIIAGIVTMSLA